MRLYFAGAETWTDLLLDMGVRNQLYSYFYFRKLLRKNGMKARTMLARMRKAREVKDAAGDGYRFMLDSGAFTYHVKAGEDDKRSNLPEPAQYFKEYKEFILEYGDVFDVIVEFDVDSHVEDITTAHVDAWTNELLQIRDIGPRVMPVYHPYRGEKWLNDWLIDTSSPLVGIGSDSVGVNAQVIAKAHRFGKFTHGFAQTSIQTTLRYTPFDAVDSTTWLRADKFGGTNIFHNGKWFVLDHLHKKDRAKFKEFYEKWGIDFKKVMEDDLETLRWANVTAWRELANDFEAKWYIRKQGKYPYLFDAWHRGYMLPAEHPLVTQARMQNSG